MFAFHQQAAGGYLHDALHFWTDHRVGCPGGDRAYAMQVWNKVVACLSKGKRDTHGFPVVCMCCHGSGEITQSREHCMSAVTG